MSVLFKSPSNSIGNIGGSSTGFPPGDVSNIIHTVNAGKVLIKWQDPEDTVLDEAIFVKWKGTILIRNKDHYPTSIKDGDIVIDNTIKNKYKDTWYEDTGLVNNHIYYYRFFPYSEDKVYNDSTNLVFKAKPVSIAPIFKDNTWEQIIAATETNSIPSTWKVGDEIDLELSGAFNETVTMQIWDFKHFDKTDGSGKANICFGMKHLMKDEQQMNSTNTNIGGWNKSYMRNTVMNNVFNSIPIELRNVIKEVNTYANKGYASDQSQGLLCKDKVFIPGYTECDNVFPNQNKTETGQKRFPIFTNDSSRKKKLNNGSGIVNYWWTRSPYYESPGFPFCRFSEIGNAGGYYGSANEFHGICFCFNI